MKASHSIAFLTGLILAAFSASAQSGEKVYKMYCTGCHGADLKGTPAGTSLLAESLKYGNEPADISKVISNGIPNTTMIKWSNTLPSHEIGELTEYIIGIRKNQTTQEKSTENLAFSTEDYTLKVEKIVTEGLVFPWGIEFVDTQRALITGNKGELYWVVDGKLDPKRVTGIPFIYGTDLVGGMMDLALDPNYAENGWIYFAYSHNPKNTADKTSPAMTKLVRGKIKNYQWVDQETLFEAPDSILVSGGTRWGSRLLFDTEGYLYFTTGDMQQSIAEGINPQLPSRAEGKIFRIYPDGSIPKDNPYYGQEGMLQGIYAVGTRNVQGLAQHPITGEIYFTDHGPKGGDEVNLLKNGGNYGWPIITYGVNYDDSPITSLTEKEGMEQPLTYYDPSIAICAAEFIYGKMFPKWTNNLLITALKDQEIRRLVIDGEKVVSQEVIIKGIGRVRDVKIGPDGALYVLTNSPDALLRVTPTK
ncbi:PQQ-dependent sugar dehydrogenase [Algoriphagus boritolerans]|uniref:Glucose/arabinose dehydrogenase, beta-propeller fold n=1 Tax=Algoriphagus boritolerans DSM 17298 = JCM 18970 TaxID=1120964 RepID=A0A1H5X4W8_9BACT|nr:PQQ-dependent sugar dehydrogenase [Algoriphagus boritolerans]SEG06397.1 Glucose/arabinose dehydrogenase, beta-propeller fold [Algoriphagus boritolerans DSM 17298 = JCM 18970]